MKFLITIQLFVFTLLGWSSANAQVIVPCSVAIDVNVLSVDCNGALVDLFATGEASYELVMDNNFNGGTVGPGWVSTGGASVGTPCGASLDGTPYYWASTSTGTPNLTTAQLDVSCGGTVCFDMAYSTQGGASPCEGPDLSNEGVTFQYSTDGVNWTVIDYWDPLGGYDPTLTTWNNYCFNIPPGAIGPNTQFQWIQLASSGTCCDNWGIDNVSISSVNCSAYWYDWSQVAGAPDTQGQSENPTSTTTYTVVYTNGTDWCQDQVTIVVPPGTNADAGPDQILCAGSPGVTIGASPVSTDDGAAFSWTNGGGSGTINLGGGVNGQGVVAPAVTTTYEVTVDFNGCTATDQMTVIVDQPPTASNPAPINVTCSANVPAANPAVVTDELDDFTAAPVVTLFNEVSAGTCPEVITRTYRVTDDCGNYVDVDQTITVMMTTGPVVPSNGSSTVECLAAAIQPVAPVVTDQCGNALTPVITENADPACNGSKVYTYTYTDCAGISAIYTYTYTITLTTAPVIAAANGTETVVCIGDTYIPTPPAVVDACGNPIVPVMTENADPVCVGDKVYTFTYTDCAGNASVWTYTFSINDNIDPTANALAPQTGTPPAWNINDVTGEADNCTANPTVAWVSDVSDGGNCPEIITRTYSVTDDCGNQILLTQIFTVGDAILPTASNPADINVECAALVPLPNTNVVTDEADNGATPVVIFEDDTPGGGVCPDTIIRRYRVTDDCGNFIFVSQFIIIEPITNPVIPVAGSSTVDCPADANVQPAGPGVITDICGNTLTPVITAPAAVACEGDMIWTFTYTDCAGNSVDWLYTYTVDMPTFAIATPSGASTVDCPADGMVQPADAGVVTDLCGNVIAPVVTAPAAVACEGDMIWTFTYTDCAGNSVDWIHTYTVDMPTFAIATPNGSSTVNCPADGMVQPADAGVITDVCGNVIVPVVTAPSAVGCTGGMVWTFTYTDCAGNTVDWLYTYIVDMPTFTLPADAANTVNCLADAQVQPVPPAMTDMCGNDIVPSMVTPSSIPCEGNMDWVFTYTDCAGNTADWIYTYTIDIPAFGVPVNGSETVECLADVYIPTAPVVTDACGNAMVPVMSENADPVCEGNKVYTFTYTDCAGNTADWTYTFTLDVISSPVVPANGFGALECVADIFVPTPPAVVDVCGNAIVPVMTENADPVCVGDKIYTFTYTDCAGNASDWTYTFSINDDVPPTASNPIPISVPGSMDVPLPDVTVVLDEADNCTANPTVAWVSDVSDGNECNLEEITRTYSVTDDCGNVTLVEQLIVILAVPAPIDAGPDDLICEGETITLTAGNPWGVPVSWNPSNPPLDGQPFSPTQTATYTVTADNLGCLSTDDVTITVEALPVTDFIADTTAGCAPFTVNFTNMSVGSSALVDCIWEINGETLTGCNSVAYTFESGGLYDVSLTTTTINGCSNSLTYTDLITVEEMPLAAFTASSTQISTMNPLVDFTNNSIGASTYLWDFGDETLGSSEENPSHTFPDEETTAFVVELIAFTELGLCTDTAWLTINVEEELLFYVPNTFTPDGDSYNEFFKPVFTSGFDPYDFTLLIFNRWGETIWESHDASVGWDGTYNGGIVPQGTYTWRIEFKTSATDERVLVTGHVNVLK